MTSCFICSSRLSPWPAVVRWPGRELQDFRRRSWTLGVCACRPGRQVKTRPQTTTGACLSACLDFPGGFVGPYCWLFVFRLWDHQENQHMSCVVHALFRHHRFITHGSWAAAIGFRGCSDSSVFSAHSSKQAA